MSFQFNPGRPGYQISYDFPFSEAAPGRPDRDEPGRRRKVLGKEKLEIDELEREEEEVAERCDELEAYNEEKEEYEDERKEVATSAGGGGDPHPPLAPVIGMGPENIVAFAISGSLLAVAVLGHKHGSWRLSPGRSRMFHLSDRSQTGLRRLASEVYDDIRDMSDAKVVVCRTRSGSWPDGREDESRVETLLMVLPRLSVVSLDNDAVADWVLAANPPTLEGMPRGRLTYPQIRAIEAAQYAAEHML